MEAKIRQRAYEIWESEGREHGWDSHHWERAREEVLREQQEAPTTANMNAPEDKAPRKRTARSKAEQAVEAITEAVSRSRKAKRA